MKKDLILNSDSASSSDLNSSFLTQYSDKSKLVPLKELDEEARLIKEKFKKIDEEKIAKKL